MNRPCAQGVLLFIAGFVCLSDRAIASPVVIRADFVNVSPGKSVEYRINGTTNTTQAGVFNWHSDPTATYPADWGNFQTFCIDLHQAVGQNVVFDCVALSLAPTIPSDRVDLLGELWGSFHKSAFTDTEAAAFQVSIWEIVFESTYQAGKVVLDVTSGAGTFNLTGNSMNSSVRTLANTWLSQLYNPNRPRAVGLVALASPTSQDQLTLRTGAGQEPIVPEPNSLVLMGMGAIGLMLLARRRRV